MSDSANVNAGRAVLPPATRQLRLGIVGGGGGGFIGPVHAIAARMDNRYQLVAGALSSRPDVAAASAAAWFLPQDRSYSDWREMARAEAARPDGAEVVAVTTPNHSHHAIARAFLDQGIHVICDKPMTATLAEAKALQKAAESSDALFVLTHNYTGYPLVRQARAMVAAGEIGTLRLVQVEYAQDWMTDAVEQHGSKQAEWRTDPARSGAGGALGDIGTHAWNLAAFVAGMEPEALAADLTSFGAGRVLDDNAHVMLRYASGA